MIVPELASPLRRVAAYLVDALIGGLFISPFLIGMRLTGDWSGNNFDIASFCAWGVPAWLIYFALLVFLEGTKGATPGKWLLGIRVGDAGSGSTIGWRRDLARRLMFWPEAIPFYLGYFWMLWDRRHQAWHDKVVSSVVVRA